MRLASRGAGVDRASGGSDARASSEPASTGSLEALGGRQPAPGLAEPGGRRRPRRSGRGASRPSLSADVDGAAVGSRSRGRSRERRPRRPRRPRL